MFYKDGFNSKPRNTNGIEGLWQDSYCLDPNYTPESGCKSTVDAQLATLSPPPLTTLSPPPLTTILSPKFVNKVSGWYPDVIDDSPNKLTVEQCAEKAQFFNSRNPQSPYVGFSYRNEKWGKNPDGTDDPRYEANIGRYRNTCMFFKDGFNNKPRNTNGIEGLWQDSYCLDSNLKPDSGCK